MPPPHHHDHHHHHHHHHDEIEDWDDYWWHELPKELQSAATILGWTEKMWDEDGVAETEDYDWHELSHEQKKAAEQFGYHPKLWDEGGHHGPPHHHPPHHHDHHHKHHHDHHHPEDHHKPDDKKEEEKKDNDEDGDQKTDGNDKKDDNDDKKKPVFKLSKTFGTSEGGDKFDHGNNRHISKLTVYHDGHVVKGLEVKYANSTQKVGDCSGKSSTLQLTSEREFITSVTVRSNKYVQALSFKTNKGNEIGPCGGKGWTKLNPLGNDSEGQEVKVAAPFKLQLCGITGRAGAYLDQIAFRWGPVPNMGNNKK